VALVALEEKDDSYGANGGRSLDEATANASGGSSDATTGDAGIGAPVYVAEIR